MCIHSEISIHGSIFRVIWLSSWFDFCGHLVQFVVQVHSDLVFSFYQICSGTRRRTQASTRQEQRFGVGFEDEVMLAKSRDDA